MKRSAALFFAAVLAGCRTAEKPAVQSSATEAAQARITQFYAESVVAKGEKANLCYGVENATAVTLDPPVERVWPAIARCFPVDPGKATKYTLTATDAQGGSVSKSVEIRTGPPRPHIVEVSINKTEVGKGEEVMLCYKAMNAAAVYAGPGEWATSHTNEQGCVRDRPQKTTTYQVKVTGAGGETDVEQVTVRVR